MRMKAAVLYGVRQPLVIEQVELDPPKSGEVLIKMVASGVCHSDLHSYTGNSVRPLPVVLGHEGAGIVAGVGPGVTRFKEGDHVVLTYLPACGQCRWCHVGQPTMCDLGAKLRTGLMLDDTPRLHGKNGQVIHNMLFVSTYAEYSVVPQDSIVKVADHLPLERLCLFGCGFTTGFGAMTNPIHIKPGESVTIVGCGGLGLAAIQGAKLSGAGTIIAVDLHEEKLSLAKTMGATHVIQNRHNPDEVLKEIMEITWGVGTDYSGEFVGTEQCDETIKIAFQAIRKGGTMCLVGVGAADRKEIPVDAHHMVHYRKRIFGVLFGDAQFKADIPRYIDLYEQGKINLDGMVTQEFALEDINTCFANVLAGNKVARQVIRF
jgi:S-(hydroxymethyl)glutathione dehydrogenase/alcohol dehydrogenase